MRRVRRPQQAAAIHQGNEMRALPASGIDDLLDCNRLGIECHFHPEFSARGGADAVLGGFLVANDASGNMPAGSVGLILPPGEQGTATIVLDQEIHVYQGRKAAEEEKEFLRQPAGGLSHPGVQRRKGLIMNLFHSCYDFTGILFATPRPFKKPVRKALQPRVDGAGGTPPTGRRLEICMSSGASFRHDG